MDDGDRSLGVAVIRAWIEVGPPKVLKVRVTTGRRGPAGNETWYVASESRQVGDFVTAWLDSLVAESQGPPEDRPQGA